MHPYLSDKWHKLAKYKSIAKVCILIRKLVELLNINRIFIRLSIVSCYCRTNALLLSLLNNHFIFKI